MFYSSWLPNSKSIDFTNATRNVRYCRTLLGVFLLVCSVYVAVLMMLSTLPEELPGWKLRRHSYNLRNRPHRKDDELLFRYYESKNMYDSHSRRLNYFDPFNDPKSITMKEDPTSRQNQDVQLQQPFLEQPRASIYKNPTDVAVIQTEYTTSVENSENLQANYPHDNVLPQGTPPGQEILQHPPSMLSQPRASIYKNPTTDTVTQTQDPAHQHQSPKDYQQLSSLEIPLHLQQQQQQQQQLQAKGQPIEFLGSAAIGSTGNGLPEMQHIKELPVLYHTPVTEMEGTDNPSIEIPQHLLVSQKQNAPQRQFETNFDPQTLGQEVLKSWESQGLQPAVEEIPMDELTRRWGEPTVEELEEKELVLPNQEQKCPISKFNPEDHKFDFAPKNLSIAEKLQLSGYKDVWDWKMQETDLPVFWHIPKSGGSTVKDIMGSCHRFVMASEAGIRAGHDNDTVSLDLIPAFMLHQ
jgi:hypothetical protein